MQDRSIGRIVTLAPPAPGFIGEGHTAVTVVDPNEFEQNDPFIALTDDRIDLEPGREAGGAHPHGGFETVTFVLEGALRDRDEGMLETGDVLWMMAGSGMIHNEQVVPLGKSRVFQLWLTLPQSSRWAAPRFEHIALDAAPVGENPAWMYASIAGVPVLCGRQSTTTQLRASDDDRRVVRRRRRVRTGAASFLQRLHGPFVGESRADLMRLSKNYLQGQMPRISELRVNDP